MRASRLRCGEDLIDIAQVLRVRLPYLEAIEEGRFGDLPGNTYAIGFIRAYADHLGLDSGEVVRRYKEDVADADKKSDLDFPVPVPESGIPGGAILFIGVVIAILAYGGWYASTTKSGFLAELVSPIPKRLSSLSPEAEKSGAKEKASPRAAAENDPAPPQSPDEQSAIAAAADSNVAEGAKTEKVPLTEAKPEPEKTVASPTPAPETDAAQAETAKPTEPAKTTKPTEPAKTAKTPTTAVMKGTLATAPPPPPEAISTQPQTAPTPARSEQSGVAPAAPAVTRSPKVTAENKSAANPKAKTQKVVEKSPPKVVSVSINADEAVKSGSDSGRIVVRAKANSWIQIRDDIGNQLVVTRLLRSGDSYRVPDRPGLKLLTGNAGALEVLVDGKVVPAIGGKGDVRRSVMLDVDRLLQGTAVVE